MRVTVIDNGGANLASVTSAFARLNADITVSLSAHEIRHAERVVLPGVGAAGDGMHRLKAAGLDDVIANLEQPVLGICLGMQLLYERSSENDTACLGVLPGVVTALAGGENISVPHMGWNRLSGISQHRLLQGIDETSWFYFVHGFAAPLNDVTLAATEHGERFAAISGYNNFVAVQFHPERSGASGAQILRNFLEWDGCN